MTARDLYRQLVDAEKALGRPEWFLLVPVDQAEIIQHPALRPPLRGDLLAAVQDLYHAGLIAFARTPMKGEFRLTNPDYMPEEF
jgi:hypothetical protein